ncbi:hypothetical protein [Tellurirhabdus rosea]|uniref:hypothetical protein n=1 Tax=Tellurirhabdus rosea TaxID=2674997 RepID=UPI002250F84B|nr:hypothetical protein [Tellurirhabdus rosea]
MNNKLVSLALWCPVVLYFGYLLFFAVNVPQLDDFGAIFVSVMDLKRSASFREFWYVLLNYHNEHRIAYTRLVAWLVSLLSGGVIDFRMLIALGSLSLLGIWWVFYRAFCWMQRPLWYFVPVSFLLFQLQYFENTFFAMASLQNFGVWCWSGLSLCLLIVPAETRQLRARFWAALGLAVLATYTSGNGLLALVVGGGVLLYLRRYRELLLWIPVACFILWAYLAGNKPLQQGAVSVAWSDRIMAVPGFLGAFVGKSSAGLAGVAVVGTALWLSVVTLGGLPLLRTYREGRPVTDQTRARLLLTALFAVIFLTALAIALNRPPDDIVSTSRYKISSILAVIVAYLLLIQSFRSAWRPAVGRLFLLAGVGFCSFTYWKNTPFVADLRSVLLQDAAEFAQNRAVSSWKKVAHFAPYKQWRMAVGNGLYLLPSGLFESETDREPRRQAMLMDTTRRAFPETVFRPSATP